MKTKQNLRDEISILTKWLELMEQKKLDELEAKVVNLIKVRNHELKQWLYDYPPF